MNDDRMKYLLESITRRNVPQNIDLMPRIAAKLERKTFMTSLRTRPALLALLIALLSILLLAGVVYALGRSLGYIPGYGVMDQNVQMRVLSAPVSQTRDGITITIDEVILTADKMFLTTTTENIPNNLSVPMSDLTTVTCNGDWIYQLPDGSQLHFEQGSGHGDMQPLDNSLDGRLSYRGSSSVKMSVPINVNQISEMTLRIPCATSDVPAGSLPENWEFHLRFVPAPAGMIALTAFPVIEYTPSPVPTPIVATPAINVDATATPEPNPILVTKVIDTGDGYVLMGEFVPPAGSVSDGCCYLTLQDADGRQAFDEMPMDIDPGTPSVNTPGAFVWARKFKKADVTLPLTIKVGDQRWGSVSSSPFAFDVGDNPQPDDEWQVKQSFDVSGVPFTLEAIRVIRPQIASSKGGYVFMFSYPENNNRVAIADVAVDGYPASINSGFSGGGSGDATAQPTLNFSVEFPRLPKGKITIHFIFQVLESERVWSLVWQP